MYTSQTLQFILQVHCNYLEVHMTLHYAASILYIYTILYFDLGIVMNILCSAFEISRVKVKGHMGQGQIRFQRWAGGLKS